MMIRAAICDDEPAILEQLREHIFDEFKRQGAVIRLDTFTSGQEFLDAHANEPFDVVFLDIDMPEISGFDVAGRISRAEHTLIVFVTMHDELVYSSFQFQPFRFIRKAYLENELPGIMEAVVNEVTKQNSERKYTFQTEPPQIVQTAQKAPLLGSIKQQTDFVFQAESVLFLPVYVGCCKNKCSC